jgi:hypothetical protein
MYKPPQQAFAPHISRDYTAQQNSQPVKGKNAWETDARKSTSRTLK